MKKLLKVVILVGVLTMVCTTMILANSTSSNNKKDVQIINKANQENEEIKQLEDELDTLREKKIVTQQDNAKENQLMEEIAQKEIANGTYDYDYKTDLQRCVNTLEAVISDCDRIIADGNDDKKFMESVKESRKLWGELADKYQKILDEDLSADEYKEASENYYKDDAQITKYLDEKYYN